MKKVFIEGVGVDLRDSYSKMFMSFGFEVVGTVEGADLVCFTGGADVDPDLYGQQQLRVTYFNRNRDDVCMEIFNTCKQHNIPMVGICRGSQFLCVANGGGLWQDVDGHATFGGHKAYDVKTGNAIMVTSTHHQMMRPKGIVHVDFDVIMTANEATYRLDDEGTQKGNGLDVEAVYWPKTNSFGFQPHPEFPGCPEECTSYFAAKLFELLKLEKV